MSELGDIFTNPSSILNNIPSVKDYIGQIAVIKCGGAAITNKADMENMMQDIAMLNLLGMKPVIVHGGGPEISSMSKKINLETKFINGKRVTCEKTLEVAQMVLIGKINVELVKLLNKFGAKAVGVSGVDGNLLRAKKSKSDVDLGYVGDIVGVDTSIIKTLISANFVPVISPIAADENYQSYNINADTVAGAVASSIGAENLLFISDIDGLYEDRYDPSTIIKFLSPEEANKLIADGKLSDGMIPKINACIEAVQSSVSKAHIINGNLRHNILTTILMNQNSGTIIQNQEDK